MELALEERWKKESEKKKTKKIACGGPRSGNAGPAVSSQLVNDTDRVLLAAAMLVPQSVVTAGAADLSTAEPVYQVNGLEVTEPQEVSESSADVLDLEHGTVNIRYRMASENSGLTALYTVSQRSADTTYAAFYVKNDTVGLELRSGGSDLNSFTADNQDVNDTEWHTLTWVFGETSTTVYVDGKLAATKDTTAMFSSLSNLDAMAVGGLLRNASNWHHACAIDEVSVYEEQFTAETIEQYHNTTVFVPEMGPNPETTYKTEPESLFYSGYQDPISYRIPSLLTTNAGTVIAAIDQRHQHSSDWGNIDTILRRREAGSDAFDDAITVIDLADQESKGGSNSAFLIDPCLVQDKDSGRIYLLIDMFPESTGFGSAQQGTGYIDIDGVKYLQLTDSDGNAYTVREGGVVYDAAGEATEYKVITECEAPYKELGDLYQGEERVGNIYLKSAPGAAPLTVLTTAYLWLTYSDDDGETWEPDVPVVITDCEPYCQLSVINYYDEEDGKEYVLLSNPSTSGRYDGTVRMGVIGENDDSVTINWGTTDGVQIDWLAKRLYAPGRFLYSCLTQLPDGNFASLYEMEPNSIFIEYTEFDKEWILAEDNELPMDDPEVVSFSAGREGSNFTAQVTFDQEVMVIGSPVLNLTMGETELEAAYVSGSATDTLTFTCEMGEEAFGIVNAEGIKEGSGTIENIHNGVPASVTGMVAYTLWVNRRRSTASVIDD